MADENELESTAEDQDVETPDVDSAAPDQEQPTGNSGRAQDAASTGEGPDNEGGGQSAQSWSAREYAEKQLGITGASNFGSEQEFLTAIAEDRQRRATEAEQLRREVEWFRQQQAQAQQTQKPAAPEKQKLFNVPEYDPAWESLVEFNERGRAIAGANGDPSIAAKVNAYRDYQRQFFQNFSKNPEETLAPLIEARAKELVAKEFDSRFSQVSDKQQAEQFIRENASWLYDQKSGQLSYAGQRFHANMNAAAQLGITSQAAQASYARDRTRLEFLEAEYQKGQAANTSEAQKKATLERGNRKPNRGGSTVGASGNGHKGPARQNTSLSLRDQMRVALEAAGVTDADFQQ
jgi:hypothetical protein